MPEVLSNNLASKIRNGENISVEFKSAQNTLPKSLFETICAMLNTGGGDIFLGIEDDGTICGVAKTSILQLQKDLANLCNNPQKIDKTKRAAKVHNIIADLSRKKIIVNKGSRNKPLWVSTKYTTKYTTNTQPNTQPKKSNNQSNIKKRPGV